MANKFFWFDVMTTDVPAAKDFYEHVVGWTTMEAMEGYTLLQVNGQGVGGIMPIPDEIKDTARPCWMAYVAVDDVDAAAARIEQAGGHIHKAPTTVEGIIRFCVVADPQGAVFLVAKGLRDEPMPQIPRGTPGTVGWYELYAADGATIFDFYEKMFGWTKGEAMNMGPMGTYQLFRTGGDEDVGGIMTKPEQIPMPNWGLYFTVDAIDAAAARVTAKGGSILNGPMQVPGGDWIVQCFDPQGAYFALTSKVK